MIYFAGSIILSAYLTLFFKVVERLRLNTFHVIVFNYITCVITGSIVQAKLPLRNEVLESDWISWAIGMGCMFISIFVIIGLSAQRLGVAVTAVAYKLSLVIPFLFSVFWYNEQVSLYKWIGIILALVAVVLTCYPDKTKQQTQKVPVALFIWIPAFIFFSSGLLDALIKYTEARFLNETNNNDFLVTAFATAALTGTIILAFLLLVKRQAFSPKAIFAGIALGIPNYFSIWCLVKVLKDYSGNSSAIIPVNNIGIVLMSAVVAWLLFKEKLSAINWTGILLAVIAIALISDIVA